MNLSGFLITALVGLASPVSGAAPVDYVRQIKPILAERCAPCHGAIRQKAGLRLDAAELIRRGGESGPAIVPGQSGESLLIDRVTGADGLDRMPPESEGVSLSEPEIALLRAWIDQGAKAPPERVPDDPRRHWAYQPPARPAVPTTPEATWARNPIDALIAAVQKQKGLRASPPVEKGLWLRRVSLDLIGLPPTREELRAFRADESSDAYERVVDRLLESPAYGERWGRHWMDVWRYSDWYGLGQEVRYSQPHLWHWRDWIVESLNADKGYDRMVVEMLAGDELAPEHPATLRATGFLARNWDIFNRNAVLASTVEHTGRAFLGVTIQCARCHDHKFDPISQRDYFRLRAFFEPFHVRIDRVPGQPDRTKDGLPRVFDEFMESPTYLFIRGDEDRPDKSRPLQPATPAVLGGAEIKVSSVALPITAASPDKRPFVIEEERAASMRAVAAARDAVAQAQRAADQATKALADAEKAEREAQGKVPTGGPPDAAKPAQEAAARSVEQWARARHAVREASNALCLSESALALAEARATALVAVLRVEALEDDGYRGGSCKVWTDAARQASQAQKRLAVCQAAHDRLAARHTTETAERVVHGLTSTPALAKDASAQAALRRASSELVQARAQFADAEAKLAKAESAAKAPISTAFTPRPLTHHRAKLTYRDAPSNAPYPRVSTGRRLALARWISDRRNPLTARVAVNHIWARHFGEPLVASMFDFGLRTERPLHHDLLDWLAVEFMESGWSMKRLHRLIVTSGAYRMKSGGSPSDASNVRLDPDNRGLWRMNVKRMEGEVLRDTVLALAGRLDRRLGEAELPVASAEDGTRRTLYYRYARDDRVPLLTMFDAANVEECYRRYETIVPQQALALTNSGMILKRAPEIAAAIDREVGADDTPATRAAFVDSAFERILGRAPTAAERNECEQALSRLQRVLGESQRPARARADLVHVLLNHNDFLTIR